MFSQTEVEPWGNITGIRIEGQLMEFETNISVVQKDWSQINATGKERQRPKYSRKGDEPIISSNIDSLYFTETVADAAKGNANVNIQLTSKADMPIEGVYYSFMLPYEDYANGSVQLNNLKAVNLSLPPDALNKYLETPATSIQFIGKNRQLKISFESATTIIVRNGDEKNKIFLQVFIPLQTGDLKIGQTVAKKFSIHASGLIEK